jgi:hypothetical protein
VTCSAAGKKRLSKPTWFELATGEQVEESNIFWPSIHMSILV